MKEFIAKHPEASSDYKTIRALVSTIQKGESEVIAVDNLKASRKYVHDLGSKLGKTFTTRKQSANSLKIVCIP